MKIHFEMKSFLCIGNIRKPTVCIRDWSRAFPSADIVPGNWSSCSELRERSGKCYSSSAKYVWAPDFNWSNLGESALFYRAH